MRLAHGVLRLADAGLGLADVELRVLELAARRQLLFHQLLGALHIDQRFVQPGLAQIKRDPRVLQLGLGDLDAHARVAIVNPGDQLVGLDIIVHAPILLEDQPAGRLDDDRGRLNRRHDPRGLDIGFDFAAQNRLHRDRDGVLALDGAAGGHLQSARGRLVAGAVVGLGILVASAQRRRAKPQRQQRRATPGGAKIGDRIVHKRQAHGIRFGLLDCGERRETSSSPLSRLSRRQGASLG
ncbi:MAG: hypothetical protein BWZ10_02647 [candidate division BRC1 bacterium ADurb.BinA364]|nr:MAG: hypothetical protein BWZ10_02647 [candidate division BRC1 bacterium ADurb.BinA364]